MMSKYIVTKIELINILSLQVLMYYIMTTIHLVYSTLEHIFNTCEKSTITLIHRRKKIKNILSECRLLPSVIDDIIFEYTDSETNITAYVNNSYDDAYYDVYLRLMTDDYKIIINISNYPFNNANIFNTNIELLNSDIGYNNDDNSHYSCIDYFNTFMKKVYKKDNYIDCAFVNSCTYQMKKNGIYCDNTLQPHHDTHGITITDYRKFTYLTVTLKCIISGIQKYFEKHSIVDYCEAR